MAPDSPSPNNPVFQTPDPDALQSEENRAEVRDRLTEKTEQPDVADLSKSSYQEATQPFDIDRISKGEDTDSTLGEENDSDGLGSRQTGVAYRSGS